jgi:syntaxin 18
LFSLTKCTFTPLFAPTHTHTHTPKQLHRQPAGAAGQSSSRPSDGFGGSGSGGGEPWQQQPQQQHQQQQLVDDQETQQLLDELTRSTQQAAAVERTVREIATMQQMLSTAVMQQAEQIEALYNVAVEATLNVRRGNEQVKRTIAVNASSTRYLVVLLLTLSALMLLFDWLNS